MSKDFHLTLKTPIFHFPINNIPLVKFMNQHVNQLTMPKHFPYWKQLDGVDITEQFKYFVSFPINKNL